MKRIIIILASAAALLMGGCSKEQKLSGGAGNEVQACFSVIAENVPSTRATVDGDGAAAKVNRFVMEVYRNHDGIAELYCRKVNKVSKGTKETKFDVTFLKTQKYDVLFWADCGNGADDKYYVTTGGLKNVTFKGTYLGNNDEMDAFSNAVSIEVGTENLPERSIYLYRPFGQLNIITTDINDLAEDTATSGHVVCPDEIEITYKAPSRFNVLTKEASVETSFTYKAVPYYQTTGKGSDSIAKDMYTLSMDYILASADEQDIRTIVMTASAEKFKLNTTEFNNIPVQRNWRTNILGALLTVDGEFKVIVDPVWSGQNSINYGGTE